MKSTNPTQALIWMNIYRNLSCRYDGKFKITGLQLQVFSLFRITLVPQAFLLVNFCSEFPLVVACQVAVTAKTLATDALRVAADLENKGINAPILSCLALFIFVEFQFRRTLCKHEHCVKSKS